MKPDLILLDLMLPCLSGEELLPRIKDFPVIVLSAKVDVDSKVKLLLEGAVDYVTKPFKTKELLARITVALRKNNSPVGNILSFADLHLDTETHMVFSSPKKDSGISSEEIRLTRTESAILKILMLNPSQVIAKSLLLERISEDTPDCTDNSLKTHMSNLRKKLRKIGGREYIEAIWGIGFRLIQEQTKFLTNPGSFLIRFLNASFVISGKHEFSMHVPAGAIYGFIGKNSSGKTTLMPLICGLSHPTAGSYTLYGITSGDKNICRSRKRMGAIVEATAIYLNLSAEENLEQQYRMLGLPSFDDIDELLELTGLADTGKKKARHFSLGMRQRLGIAIALSGNPDFLVLDEPTNGLDPQGIIGIRELILRLNREQQITFLISSHILDELSKISTHYGFIDSGSMVKEISAARLNNLCRKCVRVTVTDTKALCILLDRMGLDYHIFSDTEADIYLNSPSDANVSHMPAIGISITSLVMELSRGNCGVLSLREHDESPENYYMSLIGEERNV